MASYTIEDIELIRRKSGISYQEAVALLDYHNGNVARALVDLERNGRIKDGAESPKNKQHIHMEANVEINKSNVMNLIHKCYRARVKIHREDTTILNVSALFAGLALLISPYLVIIAVIVCMILGYKFTFTKHDHAFDGENLGRTVRNAAENMKESVRDFTGSKNAASSDSPADDASDDQRTYYGSSRTEAPYRPNYPTMNVPVQVESQDGHVTIEADKDGYTSATVE